MKNITFAGLLFFACIISIFYSMVSGQISSGNAEGILLTNPLISKSEYECNTEEMPKDVSGRDVIKTIRELAKTRLYYQDKKRESRKHYEEAAEFWGQYYLTDETSYLTKGLASVDKSIKADRGFLLAYFLKAEMLAKLGKYENAVDILDQTLERVYKRANNVTANIYQLRGVIKHKIGKKKQAYQDYDSAIAIYRAKLKEHPTNSAAIANISQTLILRDMKTEAILFLNELIARYPDETWIKGTLENYEDFDVSEFLEKF